MIEPIGQLRMLRRRALLVREVCRRWAANGERGLYADSALAAWRLSRVVSGWLIGHPNRQYHPRRSRSVSTALLCASFAVRVLHWSAAARARWLTVQLQALTRACSDTRSVTSSVSINEMLGRHQPHLLALERLARDRGPLPQSQRSPVTSAPAKRVAHSAYDADTWPFLSI